MLATLSGIQRWWKRVGTWEGGKGWLDTVQSQDDEERGIGKDVGRRDCGLL